MMDYNENDILRLLLVKDEPTILEDVDQELFLRAQQQVNRVHAENAQERRHQRDKLNLLEQLVCDMDSGELDQSVGETPILHSKLRISPKEKRQLILEGVKIQTGRFKLDEDKLIVKNLSNFLKKYHISDVDSLLNSGQRNVVYRNFRKEHNFYQCLGKGLYQRTLNSILTRAKYLLKWPEKILASSARAIFKGRGTNVSEVEIISKDDSRQLLRTTKNKSTSKSMSRTFSKSRKVPPPQVLIDISNKTSEVIENNTAPKKIAERKSTKPAKKKSSYTRKTKRQRNQRRTCWEKEDEDILVNVMIKELGKKQMLKPMFDFPWGNIAKGVPYKSASQCKKHWIKSLYWSWESRETLQWSEENSAVLIFVMHKEIVEKEHMIDWDIIFEYFRTVISSYGRLKIYWDDLKCLVPNYVKKDHDEIVLHLFHNHLPELLNICNLTMSDLQDKIDSLCSSSTS